jgi:hypothetical protein
MEDRRSDTPHFIPLLDNKLAFDPPEEEGIGWPVILNRVGAKK